MILGNSIWLWLLAASAIPVAVHLWNRKSGDPQLLGTFRFLPEQSFAKARRIELHEILLLSLRVLIICMLAFLLADFLIVEEKPNIESVIITETDKSFRQTQTQNEILELDIPTSEIKKTGWWNLIKQTDIDFQPSTIHVTGEFNQDLFKGSRPATSANISWQNKETENRNISAIWQTGTENYSAYFQTRDSLGVHSSVQSIAEPEEILNDSLAIFEQDTMIFKGSLRMIINSEISPQIQTGLEYAAKYWNMNMELTEQPTQNLCIILAGDQQFILQQHRLRNGMSDVTGASPQTGVKIEFSDLDTTTIIPQQPILETRNHRLPIFWFSQNGNAHVNGIAENELAAWFYAGAGHKLIQKSLGIHDFLRPEMPQKQREVRSENLQLADLAVKKSVRIWLLILLLLFWMAERFIAPGRGM